MRRWINDSHVPTLAVVALQLGAGAWAIYRGEWWAAGLIGASWIVVLTMGIASGTAKAQHGTDL